MGQPILSKISIATGADYALSTSTYNPIASWNKVIEKQFGDLAPYMKIFASHSQHMEIRYLKSGPADAPEFYNEAHQVILNAGPYDFLNLFAHAKYVITSSFHGTVFSLINHIPFTPIAPEKGDTRIVDLLSTVGLEQVIVHPADENFTINSEDIYSESVKKLMQDYISSSKNYLNKVLKVCLK